MKKFLSLLLALCLSLSLLPVTASAATTPYSFKTNAVTSKKHNAYAMPNINAKQWWYTDKNDKVEVLCKDGDYYLLLYPFNNTGLHILSYVPTSAVKLNSGVTVKSAADRYQNIEATVNKATTLRHFPATTTLKGASGDNVTERRSLAANEAVKILFERDGFYCIRTKNDTGFVKVSEVTVKEEETPVVVDPPTPPEPTPPKGGDETNPPEPPAICAHTNISYQEINRTYRTHDDKEHIAVVTFYTFCTEDETPLGEDVKDYNEPHVWQDGRCVCGAEQPLDTRTAYVVNTDGANLNVRKSASASAAIVGKFKAGATITVYGDKASNFYKVEGKDTDGKTISGYSHSSYISFAKPGGTTNTTTPGVSLVTKNTKNVDYAALIGKRIADVIKYPKDSNIGECVWYVRYRAKEKLGTNTVIRGNGNEWYSKAKAAGWKTGNTAKSNSIACFNYGKYGHVIFIEHVTNSTIYYTEANVQAKISDGKISSLDGVLKKMSIKSFEKKLGFQGYIYLN